MSRYTSSDDSQSFAEASVSGNTQGNTSGFGGSSLDDEKYKRPESSTQRNDVAKQEQQAVTRSKLLVAIFLILAACASAAGTYLFVQQQELNDFEDEVSHSFAASCKSKSIDKSM